MLYFYLYCRQGGGPQQRGEGQVADTDGGGRPVMEGNRQGDDVWVFDLLCLFVLLYRMCIGFTFACMDVSRLRRISALMHSLLNYHISLFSCFP